MPELPMPLPFHRRPMTLLGAAGAMALLTLAGALLFVPVNPWMVGIGASAGTGLARLALRAARATGSRVLVAAASALFGFLGIALMLLVAFATLLVLRRG